MDLRLPIVLLALGVSFADPAGARPPYAEHFEPQAGNTFVFIGDETTWQGHYTQYVEDFFYTRYPGQKVRFLNCGTKNDTAADVLARLDDDVLPLKPSHAVIMLGTWDAEFRDLDPVRFGKWREDMTAILDRLTKAGIQPILVSPPMFDRLARDALMYDTSYRFRSSEISPYYNGVMAYYSSWLRELAMERELRFADAWSPLNEVTSQQRRTSEKFTLLQDTVHPDETGSVAVARAIVDSLNPEHRAIGTVVLTRPEGEWKSTVTRGSVEGLLGTDIHVSWTWNAPCLPWVLPGAATMGVEMTDLNERFNEEVLQITGMAAGAYHVYMDGEQATITPWTAQELALGVPLHSLENRPQVHRARAVAVLNLERHEKFIQPWRDLWQQVKRVRVNFPDDDGTLVKAKLAELKPAMDVLLEGARKKEDEIYTLNSPLPVKVEVMTEQAWKAIEEERLKKEADEAKKKAEEAKKEAEKAEKETE